MASQARQCSPRVTSHREEFDKLHVNLYLDQISHTVNFSAAVIFPVVDLSFHVITFVGIRGQAEYTFLQALENNITKLAVCVPGPDFNNSTFGRNTN